MLRPRWMVVASTAGILVAILSSFWLGRRSAVLASGAGPPLFGDAFVAPPRDPPRDARLAAAPRWALHWSLDRAAYRPGDVVRATCWILAARDRAPPPAGGASLGAFEVEVRGPRGDVVRALEVTHAAGDASIGASWTVPPEAAGGEHVIRAKPASRPWARAAPCAAAPSERAFSVRRARRAALRLALAFERDAYGPGETAVATLAARRVAGGAGAAGARVDVVAVVDGATVHATRALGPLGGDGALALRVPLPAAGWADGAAGTLAATVRDGGVVETVSAALPLASAASLALEAYPEGGELVVGLPARVYVAAALATSGEPADVDARVVEQPGARAVARVAASHEGRGVSTAFAPAPGKTYELRVDRPAGVAAPFGLPAAQPAGASLRAAAPSFAARAPLEFDVAATCGGGERARGGRLLELCAYRREAELACAPVALGAAECARGVARRVALTLPRGAAADGVLRATLYDAAPASLCRG